MATLTAVDVGFNQVKALATNGGRADFPSVLGTPFRQSFAMEQAKKARMIITLPDGQSWPVGMTALEQSDYSTGRQDADWVMGEPWYVLFCAALSELHKGNVTTNVVSGLPLEDWERLADKLEGRLVGAHRFKRNGGRWQTVTIDDAFVITQGYGALVNEALSDSGHILTNRFSQGTVAIADIGGKTCNLLVANDMDVTMRWTRGDGLGLLKALKNIARDIHRAYPTIDPKAREVAGWLPVGAFEVGGERVDIAPFADPYLDPLVDQVLNLLSETWSEPGRFSAVLLVGGGSVILGNALKERMKGVYPNVTVAQDARFANVKGYLKFARDTWR